MKHIATRTSGFDNKTYIHFFFLLITKYIKQENVLRCCIMGALNFLFYFKFYLKNYICELFTFYFTFIY